MSGLTCVARFGGEPGCRLELDNALSCEQDDGHASDWCVCALGDGAEAAPPPAPRPDPTPDPRPPRCVAAPGSLAVGEVYTVRPDAHTGDEETTEPKEDPNDGAQGDRADFRRHNVVRAHGDYWYTSSHHEDREPDPHGAQWVDYAPAFEALGVGCYRISAQYRATENRAPYPAAYQIRDGGGVVARHDRVQRRGHAEYVDEELGDHFMCSDCFVRIEDPGPNSISFNRMRFTYLGDRCP